MEKQYREFTPQEWHDFKYSGWECVGLIAGAIMVVYLTAYFAG